MPMIATTSAKRTGPSNSGNNRQSAIPTARNGSAQIEFSMALAR